MITIKGLQVDFDGVHTETYKTGLEMLIAIAEDQVLLNELDMLRAYSYQQETMAWIVETLISDHAPACAIVDEMFSMSSRWALTAAPVLIARGIVGERLAVKWEAAGGDLARFSVTVLR